MTYVAQKEMTSTQGREYMRAEVQSTYECGREGALDSLSRIPTIAVIRYIESKKVKIYVLSSVGSRRKNQTTISTLNTPIRMR